MSDVKNREKGLVCEGTYGNSLYFLLNIFCKSETAKNCLFLFACNLEKSYSLSLHPPFIF